MEGSDCSMFYILHYDFPWGNEELWNTSVRITDPRLFSYEAGVLITLETILSLNIKVDYLRYKSPPLGAVALLDRYVPIIIT
jgi:hypothetical protein